MRKRLILKRIMQRLYNWYKTCKDDDLIVSILTENELLTTYRFLWS